MIINATGFITQVLTNPATGGETPYSVFVPHHYDARQPYPLIVFLHGTGETGADGVTPTMVGLGPAVRQREHTFPFICVFPQSQRGSWEAGYSDANRAIAIIDQVQANFNIDSACLHLTGIGMGGYGTWSLAFRYPERWASIVPIAGGGRPSLAGTIKDIPCWCFHGENDEVISVEESRAMIRALREAGGHPRYTEYPGVGHNCWDLAYGQDELYEWMLGQTLRRHH